MTYSEQVRNPDAALNPRRDKKGGRVNWRWTVGFAVAAMVVVAILRPAWLAKIGIQFSGSAGKALGSIANPHGWV